jgi:ubiquinone/menaquinone biosynthesis C-methylase UbiE
MLPSDDQTLVNAHFQATLPHWRSIYSEDGIAPLIYQQRRMRALQYIDDLCLPPNASLLEIGCGPGIMTVDLARRGFSVEAIDTVQGMLEETSRAIRQAGVEDRVHVSQSDARRLNFSESTFDLVLMIGVTDWLDSLDAPFLEVHRVLKPGGFLVVSAGNAWPLHEMLDPWLNPAWVPVRRFAGRLLRKTGLRKPRARTKAYRTRNFDTILSAAGLQAIRRSTLGFGRFTMFNRPLFGHSIGRKIYWKLQHLADKGYPFLRSKGFVYLIVASKLHSRKSP